jgi:hypothetical protein
MKPGISNKISTSLPGADPKRRTLLASIPMKMTNREAGRPWIRMETALDWVPITVGLQELFNGIRPDKGK